MADGRLLTYATFGAVVIAVSGLAYFTQRDAGTSLDDLAVEMTDVESDPLEQAMSAIVPEPLDGEGTVRLQTADRDILHAEIRNYILEEPEIIMEAIRILEQRRMVQEAQAETDLVATHSGDIFDDGFSYIGGNPEGSVTLVEFQDYRCGFCKRAHGEVQTLIKNDGDIRLIVKEFPILGPDSMKTSELAIATMISQGDEAYKRFSDALMFYDGPVTDAAIERLAASASIDLSKTRSVLTDPEVQRRIAATHQLGRTLSITGTPTFIIGNKFVRGYLPLAQMEEAVELSRRLQN